MRVKFKGQVNFEDGLNGQEYGIPKPFEGVTFKFFMGVQVRPPKLSILAIFSKISSSAALRGTFKIFDETIF